MDEPRPPIEQLTGPVRQVVAVIQAIGFPAAFCVALLWSLAVAAPRMAGEIVAAIKEAGAQQHAEILGNRDQLQQIREVLARLVERLGK